MFGQQQEGEGEAKQQQEMTKSSTVTVRASLFESPNSARNILLRYLTLNRAAPHLRSGAGLSPWLCFSTQLAGLAE